MTPESTFRILFWILFGSVLVMRIFALARIRRTGERVMPDQRAIQHEGKGLFAFRLASWFLMVAIIVSYALNLSWLDTFHVDLADWLRWAGAAIGLASVLLWTWTQVTLGREWSPQLHLRAEQHLVMTGPYAHIRHPMYTGISGFGIGLALVSANWLFVILAASVIIGLIFRIPREEDMLLSEFGDEYRAYMQHTGRWFPK